MKTESIEKAYAYAKERYAAVGVDTDKAVELLKKTPISLHCWQADDVVGFERNEALSGGIQTTGKHRGSTPGHPFRKESVGREAPVESS